jgi:hypothetical protein
VQAARVHPEAVQSTSLLPSRDRSRGPGDGGAYVPEGSRRPTRTGISPCATWLTVVMQSRLGRLAALPGVVVVSKNWTHVLVVNVDRVLDRRRHAPSLTT